MAVFEQILTSAIINNQYIMQSKNRQKKKQRLAGLSSSYKQTQLSVRQTNTSPNKGSFDNQDVSKPKFNKKRQSGLHMSCTVNQDIYPITSPLSCTSFLQQTRSSSSIPKAQIASNIKSSLKFSKRNRQSKDKCSSYKRKLVKGVKCQENQKDSGGTEQLQQKQYFNEQLLKEHILTSIDGVFLLDLQLLFEATFKDRKTCCLKRLICSKKDLKYLEQLDKRQYILPFFLRMLKNS